MHVVAWGCSGLHLDCVVARCPGGVNWARGVAWAPVGSWFGYTFVVALGPFGFEWAGASARGTTDMTWRVRRHSAPMDLTRPLGFTEHMQLHRALMVLTGPVRLHGALVGLIGRVWLHEA